ncbi:DUF6923 family protein, partial [Agromyces sp. GXS1127]|uniref:DUF7927 domain-containing protein n=1 Tax=Agromyces sp. GXS1127 TaxID=3424181 RepID=UPI003D318320
MSVVGVLVGASAVALTALTAAVPAETATAVPGQPGVPSDPTVLFLEDFENRTDTDASILLSEYPSVTGIGYVPNGTNWVNRSRCNGIVLDYTDPFLEGDCAAGGVNGPNVYTSMTAIPNAIGQYRGESATNENTAVSSYTSGNNLANNLVMFETDQPIPLPTPNRFITFSVVAGAQNCDSSDPLLRFFVIDDEGSAIPVTDSPINPCTDPDRVLFDGTTIDGTTRPTVVVDGVSDSSYLLEGSSVGIRLINANGASGGNDGAYDDIRILDVTPQLDKSFDPSPAPAGGTSTLTFTITNTSELAAKEGWAFSDTLPGGLTIANPANIAETCDGAPTVTANPGESAIAVSGGILGSGDVSCTISVDVTSEAPGYGEPNVVYENCPDVNVTDLVGLEAPACAEVEFYSPLTPTGPDFGQCDAGAYLFQSSNTSTPSTVFNVNLVTGTYEDLGQIPVFLNATGYNPLDDYIYGVGSNGSIYRVNSDLSAQELGIPDLTLAGLTPSQWQPSSSGEILPNGEFWLVQGSADARRWYVVDLDPTSPTYFSVLSSGTSTPPGGAGGAQAGGQDWAYSTADGNLHALGHNVNNNQELLQTFDLTTQQYVTPAVALNLIAPNGSGTGSQSAGAAFADDLGNVYGSFNQSGQIWRINADDPSTVDFFTYGPAADFNDGARCVLAPLEIDFGDAPDPTYPTLLASDGARAGIVSDDAGAPTLTLGPSVTPESEGQPDPAAALDEDDAVTPGPISMSESTFSLEVPFVNTTGDGATVAGWIDFDGNGVFDVGEAALAEVAGSGTATLTWNIPDVAYPETSYLRLRIGNVAVDALGPSGPVANGEVEDYVVELVDAAITASKSVDPEDGSPVVAGDEVTYTLSFESTGSADATIDYTDDLSGVLDDATITSDPQFAVTPDDGSVTAEVVGDQLVVTGNAPPGTTVTVSYTVTVNPDGERGDDVLGNVLYETGTTPPEECVEGDPLCTTNPVGSVTVAKDVTPDDGSSVEAGDEVTFTLTFTSNGPADAVVDYTDDWSGVLDDASLVSGPTADAPLVVTVAGDGSSFTVTGTLPPGTYTVTYTVVVNPDGERGDEVLGNVLFGTGTTPPEECVEGDPLCTSNPVGSITPEKS